MATPQSSKRAISDIWKFLDHEEPDHQSSGGVRAGINNQPSKEFLRPAAFRSSIASVESQHFHDDIQLPTFAQKYSGNVLDGSLKPSRSPFRLPRTVINDDEDPNALYAVPKKLPKSTGKRNSPPSISYAQGFSGSLFKRYEAGSILSSISSENPPVVFHDRATLVRELDGNPEDSHGDNVVYFNIGDLYARPYKRLGAKRQGNAGGRRCSCCSGKVIVAVVVAVMVAAAVVAIAVGVSVSATTSNSNSGPSSSSNSTAVTTLLVTESPGITVAVSKLNTVTLNTAWLAFRSILPDVVNVNDTQTIQPASTGTTASSEIANTQATTSLPGNALTTNSVSSVSMVPNSTEISMVTATSSSSYNVSTNSANSTSASDKNNSRIEVSVSTPLSYIGTTTNGYVITNSVSPSKKNTMSEIITKFTTPSDGAMVRNITNPDRIFKTSALGSKSWTSVYASLMVSTTPKVPIISSSSPQAVTTSQAESSPVASTTSVKHSVSSSTSIYVAKMTSVPVNLLTTLSIGNSVGEDSSTSPITNTIPA